MLDKEDYDNIIACLEAVASDPSEPERYRDSYYETLTKISDKAFRQLFIQELPLPDKRLEFSLIANRTLAHPYTREAMKEFAINMRFKLDGLPEYGLNKVAGNAVMVALCILNNIDPNELENS